MADHMTVTKILSEIEQLSYSDRMRLVESIVRSIRLMEDRVPSEATENDLDALFGIWRDRDITLAGIRERAWRLP